MVNDLVVSVPSQFPDPWDLLNMIPYQYLGSSFAPPHHGELSSLFWLLPSSLGVHWDFLGEDR